jgi:hypothetical protein
MLAVCEVCARGVWCQSHAPQVRHGLVAMKKTQKTKNKTNTARPSEAKEIDPRFLPLIAAFRRDPKVTYGGKGFGSGALKVNGKIFSMLSSKGDFIVKLPKARVTELVQAGSGRYFDPGKGRLMKEWLALDAEPSEWLALAREARRFVLGAGD